MSDLSGGRPSTRVKDLLDIVLLADAGLLPDTRLGERLRAVFLVRDGVAPPRVLPVPPSSWERDYAALDAQTPSTCPVLADAVALADRLYSGALTDSAARP